MPSAPKLETDNDSDRHYFRTRAKIHALERNIEALFASELDDAHKRLVLSVLWDYKGSLLLKLRGLDRNRHREGLTMRSTKA